MEMEMEMPTQVGCCCITSILDISQLPPNSINYDPTQLGHCYNYQFLELHLQSSTYPFPPPSFTFHHSLFAIHHSTITSSSLLLPVSPSETTVHRTTHTHNSYFILHTHSQYPHIHISHIHVTRAYIRSSCLIRYHLPACLPAYLLAYTYLLLFRYYRQFQFSSLSSLASLQVYRPCPVRRFFSTSWVWGFIVSFSYSIDRFMTWTLLSL